MNDTPPDGDSARTQHTQKATAIGCDSKKAGTSDKDELRALHTTEEHGKTVYYLIGQPGIGSAFL